jgi:hypothetical protein
VRQDAYASLAASLDAFLADPARASAVLPALARVWPELLQSIAVGLRQAPSPQSPAQLTPREGGPPAATSPGGGGASYRAITPAELTSMVHVLQLACLLSLQARQSSLAAGLLPLLLAQLPAAPPALACACLDACLALQLRHPPAFVAFGEQQGVQQVCRGTSSVSFSNTRRGPGTVCCRLIPPCPLAQPASTAADGPPPLPLQVCHLLRDRATPEPVRAHAVQFLNLLLTQVGWGGGGGGGGGGA